MYRLIAATAVVLIFALTAFCEKNKVETKTVAACEVKVVELIFGSGSFGADGESIPSRFTCDGEDVSPEFNWTNSPEGTSSFALICDDPDAPAGTWVHWVIYDIPDTIRSLPEAVPDAPQLKYGTQGRNDFGNIGYGGPCPPRGKPHRYFFKLYALDEPTGLKPGATKNELINAMKGHVLHETSIMATYKRK